MNADVWGRSRRRAAREKYIPFDSAQAGSRCAWNDNFLKKPVTLQLATFAILKLVAQGLAGFQGELNSFLGFLFSAERFEAFAFQIQDVLLAYGGAGCEVAAANDVRDVVTDLYLVIRYKVALAHEIDAHFQGGKNVFAGGGDGGSWGRRLVSGAG